MTTSLDVLKSVSELAGHLQRVFTYHFEADDHFISHIVLEFERGLLTLSAVGEDDTIALSTSRPVLDGAYQVRESTTWSAAGESALFWGWLLTNHQGYPDGVRLELRDTVSDPPVVLEAIVVASMLQVFEAREVDFRPT